MSEQKSFLDKSGVAKLWQQIKDYVTSKISSATIDYNLLFPVGKIIMVEKIDADYSNYLGFTWKRDYVGRFPVGYDPEDSDFSSQGQTGGEKEHLLTIDELPSHPHNIGYRNNSNLGIGDAKFTLPSGSANTFISRHRYNNGNTDIKPTDSTALIAMSAGGNQKHNNTPSYKVAAFWTRVA